LARNFHVAPPALTSIFVAQQLGLLIGTFLLGPLSDRFGRRGSLLACIAFFSMLTLLTTQVQTPTQFLVVRFISALFFAGVIPNSVTLSSEASPRRFRAGFVSVVMCGFTAGNFIVAFEQAFLLDRYGWQSAFWVGGTLGAFVFMLLFVFLPESPRFLARRNVADPRLYMGLQKMVPGLAADASFCLTDPLPLSKKSGGPRLLFSPALLIPSVLLWTTFLCTFFVNQLISSWNTTVFHTILNISMQRIASGVAIGTAMGIMGTCSSGFLIDRFGARRMIMLFLSGSALSVVAFGLIDLHSAAFYVGIASWAYFINSVLGGINALATMLYPPGVRGTGVAWAAGAGRAGGMIGPAFGGLMLTQGWDITILYLATGLPLILALSVLFFAGRQLINAPR
jgi:MFS transporter, AAHS family, 4-hydroxybenzoate transporter